jgi:hypothetical protein
MGKFFIHDYLDSTREMSSIYNPVFIAPFVLLGAN